MRVYLATHSIFNIKCATKFASCKTFVVVVVVPFLERQIARGYVRTKKRKKKRAGLVNRDKSKHFNVSLLMPHFNGKERKKHREICVSKLN